MSWNNNVIFGVRGIEIAGKSNTSTAVCNWSVSRYRSSYCRMSVMVIESRSSGSTSFSYTAVSR
jgi:hypothetical protein